MPEQPKPFNLVGNVQPIPLAEFQCPMGRDCNGFFFAQYQDEVAFIWPIVRVLN